MQLQAELPTGSRQLTSLCETGKDLLGDGRECDKLRSSSHAAYVPWIVTIPGGGCGGGGRPFRVWREARDPNLFS